MLPKLMSKEHFSVFHSWSVEEWQLHLLTLQLHTKELSQQFWIAGFIRIFCYFFYDMLRDVENLKVEAKYDQRTVIRNFGEL